MMFHGNGHADPEGAVGGQWGPYRFGIMAHQFEGDLGSGKGQAFVFGPLAAQQDGDAQTRPGDGSGKEEPP